MILDLNCIIKSVQRLHFEKGVYQQASAEDFLTAADKGRHKVTEKEVMALDTLLKWNSKLTFTAENIQINVSHMEEVLKQLFCHDSSISV